MPAGVYWTKNNLSVDVLTALCRSIILIYDGSSSCSIGVGKVGSWLMLSGMPVMVGDAADGVLLSWTLNAISSMALDGRSAVVLVVCGGFGWKCISLYISIPNGFRSGETMGAFL